MITYACKCGADIKSFICCLVHQIRHPFHEPYALYISTEHSSCGIEEN